MYNPKIFVNNIGDLYDVVYTSDESQALPIFRHTRGNQSIDINIHMTTFDEIRSPVSQN
jgi:hypothetical protein